MSVGIVGAGAMGGGIARAAAGAGHRVLLYDTRAGAAEQAVADIAAGLNRRVDRGRLARVEAEALLERLAVASGLEALGSCSLVIEAVVEDLDVKREVFSRLEAVVASTCVLATNTSSLSVAAVFRDAAHPDRTLGLHFFNPAHVMPLVEVIPGPRTEAAALSRAQEFVQAIGKTGIEVSDSPGFLVNFVGRAYTTEALAIAQERTATPRQIDRIMTEGAGFPLGPFALMDLTGIDVNYPVTRNLFEHNFADPMLRSTWMHQHLYDSGRLGNKTGGGFHEGAEAHGDHPGEPDIPAEPAHPAPTVVLPPQEGDTDPEEFCRRVGLRATRTDDGASPILIAPLGEDCAEVAARTGLDARRVVAVDLAVPTSPLVTLMAPPGADPTTVRRLAAHIAATVPVEVMADSAGFVAQRILAAVVNLGCEAAQRGIARPEDIDRGAELGLNYPEGPLALAERHGPARVARILDALHRIRRDDRYRTSQWLRRRVLTGTALHQPDFGL